MPIPFSWVSATPITATSAIPILNPSWNWAKTDGAGIKTYLDDYYSKKTNQYRHELKKAPTLAFESMDSGWANWYWGATAVHDSTIKQLWTASIQMPCPTAWTSVGMRKNITDLDLSGDTWVEFWVRSDDWANVDAVEVLLWDSGFTNYWILDLKLKVSSETLENNVWHEFTFSKGDFPVGAWTINWATVQDMIVRARSTAWTTPTVWMDSFRFFEYPSITSWTVLFCADDGWNDQSNLLSIADEYGQKVCLFVIPQAIWTSGYFTQVELDDAHDRGHIIALHGWKALTTLTGTILTEEIAEIVAYRNAHPEYRGGHMFALPEGKINEEVKAALTPYFKYIFAIDEQKAYPYPNESLRTPRRSLLNTTSTAVAQGLMDTAMSGKGLQIINFHHIVATTAISTDYSIADTTTLFAYASTPANGINVGDWLSLFPDSGDTTAPTQTDELAKLEGGNVFEWNQTFDTNTLFVDATNNRVWVWTASPARPFHLYSASAGGGTPNIDTLGLIEFTGNKFLHFKWDNATWQGGIAWSDNTDAFVSSIDANMSSRYMRFYNNNAEVARFDSTGKLGIWETVPDYKLDVNGSIWFTPWNSVTPVDNGDVVFELTNNTTLTIRAKWSDGTVRSWTITLA
jgi:hypothetical protein